ncbi:MAG: hypothetical protein V2B18_17735 [Pseudomonadota bacterium]
MERIILPFVVLSAVGFAASAIAHTAALAGLPQPLGRLTWCLHGGVFVVWVPMILVSRKLSKKAGQTVFWKTALRACPPWMFGLTIMTFVYAIINMALYIILTDGRGSRLGDESMDIRGFSGHWMAFYAAALSVLYSSLRSVETDAGRKPPEGPQ